MAFIFELLKLLLFKRVYLVRLAQISGRFGERRKMEEVSY